MSRSVFGCVRSVFGWMAVSQSGSLLLPRIESADLEDILAAFDALDAEKSIPPIYCGATELPRLPPLSLDPVSEQVQDSTKSLLALTSAARKVKRQQMYLLHNRFNN